MRAKASPLLPCSALKSASLEHFQQCTCCRKSVSDCLDLVINAHRFSVLPLSLRYAEA
jgi:hypothetical protein